MKNVWMAVLTAATAVLLAARPAGAQGMSSANYSIPVSVINSGGGVMTSANYTLVASIGEPVIGTAINFKGDVNRDGSVTLADVKSIMQIADGAVSSTDPAVSFPDADVIANGKIEVSDALGLTRAIMAGSIPGTRLEAGFLASIF